MQVVLTHSQVLAHGRMDCKLRAVEACEGFTRPVFVNTANGVQPACPTCVGVEVVRPPFKMEWIVHPYYTGRDKGPCHDGRGNVLTFPSEGRAWEYVFTKAQPNDDRAASNYHVYAVYSDVAT